MLKQLSQMFASQKWLRTFDPKAKRDHLAFRLSEVLHEAISMGMDLKGASVVVSKGGLGVVKTTRGLGNEIARVSLDRVRSLQLAHRLVYVDRGNLTESQVDRAVERAFDDLAHEILRQVYGPEYTRKHFRA